MCPKTCCRGVLLVLRRAAADRQRHRIVLRATTRTHANATNFDDRLQPETHKRAVLGRDDSHVLGGLRVQPVPGSSQHPVLPEWQNRSNATLARYTAAIAKPVVHAEDVQQRLQRTLLRCFVERVPEVGHHQPTHASHGSLHR